MYVDLAKLHVYNVLTTGVASAIFSPSKSLKLSIFAEEV